MAMNAFDFNKKYPIESKLIYLYNPALRGGRCVKTVGPANVVKGGLDAIVEISCAPHFVYISQLRKLNFKPL